MNIYLFVSGFIVFFAITNFLSNFSDYRSNLKPYTLRITFKAFQKRYAFNPEKYKLESYCVQMQSGNNVEEVQFSSYIDWRKYIKMLERI